MTSALARAAAAFWRGWRRLIQALLGAWEWQAPPWSRWLGGHLARAARGAAGESRRHPVAAGAISAAALALAAGALTTWHWYQHRPKPDLAAFRVTPPGRTRIEDEKATPDPLVVRFDRSAAALAAAGKELGSGIRLDPQLAGTWRWVDDRVLEFRVQDDWPVGQTYRVTFERSMFGPQTRLLEYGFKFSTAPFTARIQNTELYQDPVDPGIKKAAFDVRFSHPVDAADFERRVELQLAGQAQGVLGVGRETTDFTVVYDKWRLNASIHSAALPIPKNPTELQLRIGPGLRAARGGNPQAPLAAAVRVPGLYSLAVTGLQPLVVDNERNEPRQVLMLSLSAASGERDVAAAVKAWVLPKVRPAQGISPAAGREDKPYDWDGVPEVTGEVLAQSEALPLEPVPSEREYAEDHGFRYSADVGRYLYVQVERNLRSFGGYLSPATERFVVRVPPYPPQLKILSQGSLLALSGERKVVALVRDLPGVRIDIGRLLPDQLQHLVSQSEGNLSNPVFNGNFGPDNLVERFERKVPFGTLPRGRAHYEPIDLGAYLKADGEDKRGLFLLTVRGYDPAAEAERRRDAAPEDGNPAQSGAAPDAGALLDQRLVLITDLGLLAKKSADGTLDVFVQSIQSGQPVTGVAVEIVAKNGTTLFSRAADANGRAHFGGLAGLARERAPLYVQARKGGDLSFLPLNRADRTLDYSRFDVGGIRNARSANEIGAYLFSDRGVYRPGETIHVGMIVKTADWSGDLAGIPLEYAVFDARGLTVKRERFKLPAAGFAELDCATAPTAPTGTYTVNLFIVKDGAPGGLLGTATVRVQEFAPDRMKVSAHLSAESADGWVHPAQLKALVNVQNLFGTPAEHRRVEASLTLTPAYPAFRAFPDYRFYDPQRAKEGYTEKLHDAATDAVGNASFDLGLQKYAPATYRVHVLARAFEPEGGRSVAADCAILVSELPFLVGFKADGELGFVPRGSSRLVSLIAVDPSGKQAAAPGLRIVHLETRYVSVLVKQDNGIYKYESRKKETTLSDQPLTLAAGGAELTLATGAPGSFAYSMRDASGLEMNRVEYTVAGQGNVTRSLDRNAELQITLDKQDYAPGEDIALSIKAPYTGAGLITIERDHVYAAQWFKADTTASVQRIRVPRDFEGNGYVSVQFIRDPSSDEIFTSPLSFGVAPFVTSLAARTNALSLQAPARVKPGDVLHIGLEASHASRAVVFAVDEGILQVARYQAPDPLGEFFKKRALEVGTAQILDLILPEFKQLLAAAAPGGDADAALRRNLNPFKRKRDQAAVYWSGIVEVPGARGFDWTVPDSFNGAVKIFAVSVDSASIGVAQAETLVRGDFVLTPNLPVAVAPGDEFEVSVGVANGIAGSGAAEVAVSARLPAALEAVGPATRTLRIDSMREGVAVFRFRALPQLGSASITFSASWQGHEAHRTDSVSVRPASPYLSEITAGYFGPSTDIAIPRVLYPDHRKLELAVSSLPLVMVGSVADYLDDYPHLCTEQLVSRGFSTLIRDRLPELAEPGAPPRDSAAATAALVAVLRSRQNAEGGFGLWAASVNSDEFASVYAVHWLIEAREQGAAVPEDLLQSALAWLQRYAASPLRGEESGLWGLRNRAYAAYLLTRRGAVVTPILASLRETLDARYPKEWKSDAAAAYLAAAYQLQKQEREAGALIDRLTAALSHGGDSARAGPYANFDDSAHDAQVLYLVSRHFPARARALPPQALQALLAPLSRGDYNTLSSAYLALALDAYAANLSGAPGGFTATQTLSGPDGGANSQRGEREAPLDLSGHLILRASYGGSARRLRLDNAAGITGFYAVTNAGFDTAPPQNALSQGMEILREYLDAEGRPVSSVKTGDEITVRLRLRSIDALRIPDVALTDMLPGGFEPVLQQGPAAGWRPDFVDVREDRVVLYGSLSKDLSEFTYRIRATNAGAFLVPPGYAESMYDRKLRARTLPGRITVAQPATP